MVCYFSFIRTVIVVEAVLFFLWAPPPSSLSSCSIYSACEVIFYGGVLLPPLPDRTLLFLPLKVFSTRVAIFVVVSFQWCTVSLPLRVYERHGACPCPEKLGSSVMWWVYIFKNKITPIVWIMSIIVILNFCCWWWLYIYFSVQQCTVNENHSFIVGFHFLWICCLCSTCCTETFQRKKQKPLPLLFRLFCSFFFWSHTPFPPASILWALLLLSP